MQVHAHRACLARGDVGGGVGEPLVAGGTEGHGLGKERGAGDTEADAALEVGGREERQLRQRLQAVQRRGGLERLAERHGAVGGVEEDARRGLAATEDDEAADVLFAHQGADAVELVAVGPDVGRSDGGHEELPDFLVDGHRGEGLRHPTLGGAIEASAGRGSGFAGWAASVATPAAMARAAANRASAG